MVGAELRTPGGLAWRSRVATELRRDGVRDSLGFHDVGEAITGRFELESPAAHKLTVATQMQRRDRRALDGGPRTFIGPGLGAYDSLGNFTGSGAYDLTVATGAGLVQLARAASSAQVGWTFGSSDAWRGSRIEFVFESDARRRGEQVTRNVVFFHRFPGFWPACSPCPEAKYSVNIRCPWLTRFPVPQLARNASAGCSKR